MKTKELYRKFNITLVVSLLCVLFITAMINLLVNPYNIFGVPACKLTYLKPESKTQERVTKLIGIKFDQRKLDSIFLGSTRVDTAIAKDYFYNKKHQTVEIIKLNGSIELAPIVGLSEVICDIVETGSTLRENGLSVLEEVCPLSARMVVNQVSMKMENERITKLISDLKTVVNKEK